MRKLISLVLAILLLIGQSNISIAEENLNNPPNPPINLNASIINTNSVTLSWDVTKDARSYDIYRSVAENDEYTKVGSINQPTDNSLVFFTDTNLESLTSYWYKVISINDFGQSTDSVKINVVTKDTEPVNKIISPKNGEVMDFEDIQLKWINEIQVTESTIVITDLNINKKLLYRSIIGKTYSVIPKSLLTPGHKYKVEISPKNASTNKGTYIIISIKPFPSLVYVGKGSPFTKIPIKSSPKTNAKVIGYIYGGLMNIDIYKDSKGADLIENNYYKIKTWNYDNTKQISKGYLAKSLIKKIKTNTKFGLLVDISDQKMYIYKNDKLIDSYLVSTGLDSHNWQTPAGVYVTGPKIRKFYTPNYNEGAYYGVRFNKGYMFHSLVTDKHGKVINEEKKKLGQKASHGCVRQLFAKAKWLYDHIPSGTPVIIQE